MASYEDDHNIPTSTTHSSRTPQTTTSPPTSRRDHLNLPEFFSSNPTTSSLTHAVTFLTHLSHNNPTINDPNDPNDPNPLLHSLLATLSQLSHTTTEPKGVPDGWTDKLDRVPKKDLKKDDICPICSFPFLDDPYPLVVRLPCHERHLFDLECLAPWVKVQATCPLDRTDLLKKKPIPTPPPPDEEEEEEWDENYG